MDDSPSAARGLAELATLVQQGTPRVIVPGLAQGGAFSGATLARVAETLAPADRPLVVVTPDEMRATQLAQAIQFFLPDGADVLQLPAVETSPYAEVTPDRRAIMRRLAVLFRLATGQGEARAASPSEGRSPPITPILVASVPALLRRVIPRAELDALCEVLLAEAEMSRDAIARACIRAGYQKSPVVEDPGTFALRGGVVDVWPPMYPVPARLEMLGDLIESIRSFDPATQRTLRVLPELYLHPARETVKTAGADPRGRLLEAADAAHHPSAKTRWILEQVAAGDDFFGVEALAPAFHARMAAVDEYFPKPPRYALIDPEGIWTTVLEELGDARERFTTRRSEHRLVLAPEDHFLATEDWRAMLGRAAQTIELPAVELHELDRPAAPTVHVAAKPNRDLVQEMARVRAEKADSLLAPLLTRLRAAKDDGYRVALVATGAHGADRLRALLEPHGIQPTLRKERGAAGLWDLRPGSVTIFQGTLRAGFELPSDFLLVITEEEIFGPRAPARPPSKQTAARAFGSGDLDFANLKPGDFVVHAKNGIGKYQGMKKLPLASAPGVQVDFLHLEYDGGALYLPVYRLSEITPYVGADGAGPKLDRLGGVTWEKTKRKVSAEIKKMAEELLQLYAQRQALPGHAFPAPDETYREFEATFPYEETPDQQKAIDDVLADMEEARPMDRLVCGDVGYGKTEVALRAALKAALGGKQVAVLAPTTVLVEQHVATFTERFKGWPVKVAGLSRFSSKADQVDVVKKLASAEIDVVIGTHRLLSGDVRFKDLGLVVIDEEQRFGVAHKEKLKKLRTQVDTLVLTATPIPRTLHLGLLGLREISIISTPPVDRLAVRTLVSRPDDDVIRDGIKRELARGGQVFFVAHRIGGKPKKGEAHDLSLEEWADHLRALVPEARVVVGHGQMEPETLERVMTEFVAHQHDILVSTTIIESGLDIPRANTMFVARADMFGLAQLYQLRGRIGRSRERATCYLMIPPESQMTEDAKARLNVLQRFTELGAGFQIASHDLEIRGAGDFLGKEQSGQIAAVGFETYTAILEEAVAELKGEALRKERDPEMTVDYPAFIPDDYVPDTGQRLGLYKRLGEITGEDGAAAILEEMHDRYGEVPEEAKLLAEVMIVKALARDLAALSVDLTQDRLILALDPGTPLKPEKVLALVNKKGSPYRLTPDMRLQRSFLEPEKKDRLTAARRALLELQACAN